MSKFSLPLLLFYDNSENKKNAGMKRGDDNISMFLKTKLISFSDDYAVSWLNEEMANEKFVLSVSDNLLAQYAQNGTKNNMVVYEALCQIGNISKEDCEIYIKAHKGEEVKKRKSLYEEYPDGSYRWKYHYVKFSNGMIRALSRLFVSTIVYNAQKISWPTDNGKKVSPEGMMVEFDTITHKAIVYEISVLTSNVLVPFQRYINEVLNQIWDEIEKESDIDDNEKAVDFYTDMKIDPTKKWGVWRPVKDLDDALEKDMVAPYGIYMLYNSSDRKLYIGKAKEVYSRIDQHRKSKNAKEPMKHFDYFRFSLVDKKHYNLIYLIENAAIHDCAAIFSMPHAKTGRLNNISLQGHVTDDLNNIIIVNTDEAQTKWG